MELRPFFTVFFTIFVAELGDKTQLATLLFSTDDSRSKAMVFAASASALVLASGLGVLAGGVLASFVSPRALSWLAGLGFIAIGLWTLARAGS